MERGYHGTKVEDIADAAGVSRASFYTYFPSKRDLLLALGVDAYRAMDANLNAMRELAKDDAVDLVEHVVRSYMQLLDEHGGFILVWSQAGFEDPELLAAGVGISGPNGVARWG